MRLAVYFLEEQEAMLTACTTHKPGLDEWMDAAKAKNIPVSEGVTFGDCPVEDGKEHIEYTDGAESDPKL